MQIHFTCLKGCDFPFDYFSLFSRFQNGGSYVIIWNTPPPIRDIGMYTSPFHRFDFASIFIVFSFSKMADLMALYEIPPQIQRVHMLFCNNFNFYHFVVFKDGELYNVIWITPPPLIRDLGMSTWSFCRLILHQFSSFSRFPRWRILDVIWNTPG